ncbi:MAG: nitroreductase/quinone reductase family protein [Dermatophilaceae bacterium]
MTYVKPPAFTRRIVNPIVSKLKPGGVATLTVAGRRSGRRQHVPVIPVAVGDAQYLVSPYGESQWVRNLRASGVAELSGRGRAGVVARAVEVPVADRAPIITAYRKAASRAVDRFFTRMPDPGDHPVFQLTSADVLPSGRTE